MGGLVFRSRLIRWCARICAVSAAYVRKFYWKLLIKKLPWLVLPAPSGPRAKRKAQTTAPERGSGRGMSVGARGGVLQTALMGLIINYGPATAKSAQMDLARGFARWLLRDDPDTDDGIFSVRLSIPMVGLVQLGGGMWVWGSGVHRKVGPLHAPTWGWSWKWKA